MKKIIVMMLIPLMAMCKNSEVTRIENLSDNLLLKLDITRMSYKKNEGKTFVYGHVKIASSSKLVKLKSANLNCLALIIGEHESSKVYVDSPAHVLIDEYKAKNNIVAVNLYWVFNSKRGKIGSLGGAMIRLTGTVNDCFNFEELEKDHTN